MSVESLFLDYSVKQLREFTGRIETCLGKLSDEQIWARGGEHENAVGNLVLHLCGNVRQWIVTTLGDDPAVRDRDGEFNAKGGVTAAELSANLKATVERAAQVISNLDTAKLTSEYNVQVYRVSGVEAVYHVVEHFAQHTGQIIFLTKMLTGGDLGFYGHLRSDTQPKQ